MKEVLETYYSPSELLDIRIRNYLNDNVYTALPGIVVDVADFSTEQTITVKPTIRETYSDGIALPCTELYKVPVIFPSAGGGILSFPIAKGDTVLLIFSKRSLPEWLDGDGDEVSPETRRNFAETDAIAIAGLSTINGNLNPDPVNVQLKFKNSKLTITPADDITVNNSNGTINIKPDGEIVLVNGGGSLTLKTNGEVLHHTGAKISASGDFITASGISLDNHTHMIAAWVNASNHGDSVDPPE